LGEMGFLGTLHILGYMGKCTIMWRKGHSLRIFH